MRLRKDPLALAKLQASNYQITNFPVTLHEDDIIELAMGKGEMIVQLATNNPHKFYFGIEKEATVALKAAQKAQTLQLQNFKIICDDISNLPAMLQGQVAEIGLTFPDPGPKNRHADRRLTSAKFLKMYANLLTANGKLRFKTDNDQLFHWSMQMLQQNHWQISYWTNDLQSNQQNLDNILTGYEKKGLNSAKNINYLEAKYLR